MSEIQVAFKSLMGEFPQYNDSAPRCEAGPVNVLSIIVLQDDSFVDQDSLAQNIEQLLAGHLDDLEKADVRRVSFIVAKDGKTDNNLYPLPSRDSCIQRRPFEDIEPTVSYQLETLRLTKNFSLTCLGDRMSPSGQIYHTRPLPKASALAKDKKANRPLPNLRTCLGASQSTIIDPVSVEQVVASILKRHSKRTTRLGIAEVEAKAVCKLADDVDSHPISLRLVASNPTGFVQVMNTYVEAVDESGSKRVFKSIGGTKASLAGSARGKAWTSRHLILSQDPLMPKFSVTEVIRYPLLLADLPALFEAAVEKQWASVSAAGTQPTMVMFTTELVVRKKSGGHHWTMADYMNGQLELVETQRKAGKNDVGMVAWLMTLKTVECPNGRQIVLIANDITHKAGSFGTREDVVFKLASVYARQRRVPRLYMAANSGARIGLAEGIKKTFKVALQKSSNSKVDLTFFM
ncbi:LOW QUALITY PROTEIN: hypothetical protein ACHAW5_006900 [Stephanodiscus triporus]|uniref:CoA carboxyltransferase N-terminal domain-containing protein n=1 Tax=Stephanodiscus triporus TaxID=2934178 RepID=A0ABD3Q677_9STRA